MHIEVDILRRQVTYHVYNAGCFIRLNRVSYPGYVVYIISDNSFQHLAKTFMLYISVSSCMQCIRAPPTLVCSGYNYLHG